MQQLIESLLLFLWSGLNVVVTLGELFIPWIPLVVWICFWMFAVNWVKLREVLLQGAGIGVFLIGLMMIMVWGVVAPPVDGYHEILGLELSNFVGKAVYVTALFCIMFLSGAVQLSGSCGNCCQFDEDEPAEEHAH